jgi:hypothetical protein
MGNYSKTPSSELTVAQDHGYCAVRFQQGKPVLDRELNLAVDLAGPSRLASMYLGNGVAAGTNGFLVSNLNVGANDFTISAGRCLVNGLEAVLLADTTYRTQPTKTNVTALPSGASNVYLHVFTREVNGAEDSALLNPGDVKLETSVRDKVEWEVLVSARAIDTPGHFLLATINTAPPTVNDRRRLNLALSACRDEMDAARGSAVSLAARLQQSLAANGALLPNSVTQDRLAASAVALPQLKQANVFSGSVTVAPATENSLVFLTTSRHAIIFTSVVMTAGTGLATWREFVSLTTVGANTTFNRGLRIKNENPAGGATITVVIQAIEVAQS